MILSNLKKTRVLQFSKRWGNYNWYFKMPSYEPLELKSIPVFNKPRTFRHFS